jgi:hypothetical protein
MKSRKARGHKVRQKVSDGASVNTGQAPKEGGVYRRRDNGSYAGSFATLWCSLKQTGSCVGRDTILGRILVRAELHRKCARTDLRSTRQVDHHAAHRARHVRAELQQSLAQHPDLRPCAAGARRAQPQFLHRHISPPRSSRRETDWPRSSRLVRRRPAARRSPRALAGCARTAASYGIIFV